MYSFGKLALPPPKPVLPGSARKHRVQAEFAIQQKRWVDALLAYGPALAIAPWWPEVRFNSAIVLVELGLNDNAIMTMKRYVELVPNAPDARRTGPDLSVGRASDKGVKATSRGGRHE